MSDREPVNIMGVIAFPNPDHDKRMIRFIDSEYHTLFTIKDGESIVITRFDGEKMVFPCKYIDDCHVCIGNSAYHICEFAEMQERSGNTYVPRTPKISAEIGTYEIYQIPATADVDYYFRPYQTEDYPDEEIKAQQAKLNVLYDAFTRKYGLINSRGNAIAFDQDSSYFLLCSLEILDEDRNLKRKADLFTRRTIRSHKPAEKVDTAVEALALSIGEKAHVDMEYMSRLTGKDEETLFSDLKGVVFLNPNYKEGVNEKYLPADEYLSGNVRQKWAIAKAKAEQDAQYQINAEALARVQPTDLTASEISVRLGATWLDTEYVRRFIFETLGTPRSAQWGMKVHYSKITGEWRIEDKNKDRGNVKAISTYGTKRVNAYEIIETTLKLKDVRIFDYQYDEEGRRIAVLNKKETAIAQSKQELIKDAFAEWIWKDPDRREAICKTYNILFNSNRPREYDGSHINFSGMNPEITLRKHQVNAIAHILYGGNTLLAHVVGAGKTFEMVAAAMESKRLGL